MSKRKKKKRTGLKVLVGLLAACVIGVGGYVGYNAWQYMKIKQSEEAAAKAREASYEQEVASMQSVYKEWTDAVAVDTIYEGVSAMGVELSGLTEEEAAEKLSEFFSSTVLDHTISLQYKGKTWDYTYKDLGFTADTADVAASAYGVCRTGSIRERYNAVQALKTTPVELMLSEEYDASKIDEILKKIDEEVRVEPKDAVVTFKDGDFVVTKEVEGQEVDIEETKKALEEKIAERSDIAMDLVLKELKPEVTEESLKGLKAEVIGTFSTYYDLENHPRNVNLEVGCAHISGLLMMPGDSFNYNETVSPVTAEGGYMEASTISNGQYVPGFGGGLCQVSTTLYNAVIRAELEVTERYPHSLEPGYVVNGQDAAIAIGGKNFQFVNSSKYPIYIVMQAYGGTLSATIYGVEEDDPSREIYFDSQLTGRIEKPEPIITYDPEMYEDEQEVTSYGREGLKYDVYKVITENGKTWSEYFSSSTYIPVADRITKGTKKRPEPEQTEESEETQDTEETVSDEENADEGE